MHESIKEFKKIAKELTSEGWTALDIGTSVGLSHTAVLNLMKQNEEDRDYRASTIAKIQDFIGKRRREELKIAPEVPKISDEDFFTMLDALCKLKPDNIQLTVTFL